MKLIDKDALVAEIERKKEEEVNYDDNSKDFASYADHIYYSALDSMQDFINTLEVKEVDLEKEYKVFVEEDPVYNKLVNGIVGKAIAKHFFELGLRVNNEKEK